MRFCTSLSMVVTGVSGFAGAVYIPLPRRSHHAMRIVTTAMQWATAHAR